MEGIKVFLLVSYIALYPGGDIANQNYWYITLSTLEECEAIRDGEIDFGSVSSPIPDFLTGKYHVSCIVESRYDSVTD